MFDNLSSRLNQTIRNISGKARLTEDNIKDALREVRMALLEADVALPVVKEFIAEVKERAMGADVLQSISPGQAFIKIVNDELAQVMGDKNESLNLATQPPAVILMAGLQGAGKTTTVGKLARFLKEKEGKSVMVVSCDIYRPAAIKQLETVAGQVDVDFYPSKAGQPVTEIARNALDTAKKQFKDVLIVDTAGRMHIDEEMMGEIQMIHQQVSPVETLFVVDSMTGQDAANTARAFNDALPLTGVILTKADGDARGGAALSVRRITDKPIKFLGMGEKLDALEPFYPDRVASRILGMGDVVSLVERAQEQFDEEERLVTDLNLANSGQTYTANIEIPEDVMPGERRLRIRANWQNSAMDPCASWSYGETEDYTVNITGDIQGIVETFENTHGYYPKVIVQESGGLTVVEENEKSLAIVKEVYLDLMKISYLSDQFGGPHFMSPDQIRFIDNWEVEHYRRKVAKGKGQ